MTEYINVDDNIVNNNVNNNVNNEIKNNGNEETISLINLDKDESNVNNNVDNNDVENVIISLPKPLNNENSDNNIFNVNNNNNNNMVSLKKRTKTPWLGNFTTINNRIEFYEGITFQGIEFYKDFTIMLNRFSDNSPKQSHSKICKISSLFEDRSKGIAFIEFIKLNKPEDLPDGRKPFHGSKELFPTNESIIVKIEDIKRLVLCTIQSKSEFEQRLQFPMNAFFCNDQCFNQILVNKGKYRVMLEKHLNNYDSNQLVSLDNSSNDNCIQTEMQLQEEEEVEEIIKKRKKSTKLSASINSISSINDQDLIEDIAIHNTTPKKKKEIDRIYNNIHGIYDKRKKTSGDEFQVSDDDKEELADRVILKSTPSKMYIENEQQHGKTLDRLKKLGQYTFDAIDKEREIKEKSTPVKDALERLKEEKKRRESGNNSPIKLNLNLKEDQILSSDEEDNNINQPNNNDSDDDIMIVEERSSQQPLTTQHKLIVLDENTPNESLSYDMSMYEGGGIVKYEPETLSQKKERELKENQEKEKEKETQIEKLRQEYETGDYSNLDQISHGNDDGDEEVYSKASRNFVKVNLSKYDNNNLKITNFFEPKYDGNNSIVVAKTQEEVERMEHNRKWSSILENTPTKNRVLQFEPINKQERDRDPELRKHLFSLVHSTQTSISRYFDKSTISSQVSDSFEEQPILAIKDNDSSGSDNSSSKKSKSKRPSTKKRKDNNGDSNDKSSKRRLIFEGEDESANNLISSSESENNEKCRDIVKKSKTKKLDNNSSTPIKSKRLKKSNKYFMDDSDQEDLNSNESDDYEIDDFVVQDASDLDSSSEEEIDSKIFDFKKNKSKEQKKKKKIIQDEDDNEETSMLYDPSPKKNKLEGPIDIDTGKPMLYTQDNTKNDNSLVQILDSKEENDDNNNSSNDDSSSNESDSQEPNKIIEKVKKQFSNKLSIEKSFNIFVQYIISCIVDEDFSRSVIQDKDEYFLSSIARICKAIESKKDSILSSFWHDEFLFTLVHRPFFHSIEDSSGNSSKCKSCNKDHHAGMIIYLSGRSYDAGDFWKGYFENPKRLKGTTKDEPTSIQYELGDFCFNRAHLYHRLHHFSYKLFRDIKSDVKKLQEKHEHWTNQELLEFMIQPSQSYLTKYYNFFCNLLDNVDQFSNLKDNK